VSVSGASSELSSARRPAWDRIAAATGAGFVLLILVGNQINVSGTSQAAHPTGRQVLADAAEQAGSSSAAVGFVLEVTGFVAFLVFLAYVATIAARRRLSGPGSRGPEGAPVLAAATAVLGGLTMLVVKLGSAVPIVALMLDRHQLPPTLARVLYDMGSAAFVLSWLPFAVFVGGLAVLLHGTGIVGRPTTYVGLVLAAVGSVLSVAGLHDVTDANPMAFVAALLWVLVVSGRMALRRAGAPAPEPSAERSTTRPAPSGAAA
jgi:hypothetical protein